MGLGQSQTLGLANKLVSEGSCKNKAMREG